MNRLLLPLFSFLISCMLLSCSGNTRPIPEEAPATETTAEVPAPAAPEAPSPKENPYAALAGLFQGVQEAYYIKNQYGDDMVVNGNKIPVPSADYKFLIKENNKVSLQQTNLENSKRYYYEGDFSVLEDDGRVVKLECNVSDGSGSSPTYILTIDKSSLSGTCKGNKFELEFSIARNATGQRPAAASPSSSSYSGGITADSDQPVNVDGIYSYRDESVSLQVIVSNGSWKGKTVIITGMGSEYDDVTYESGSVRGNTLYESSGYVEIGYVNGRNLTTTIGNNRVTLVKN